MKASRLHQLERLPTIDAALLDPRLLGAALGDPVSWRTWRVVLKAAFGLELNREEARAFASVAGSRIPPTQRVRELWCVVGRRGGKSRMAALIACYLATLVPYKLAPGETGQVLVVAASVVQAKAVFDFCLGWISASPLLRREIASTTASEIRLKNGIVIACHASSFRTVRGRTLVGAVLDEVSFWRDESSALPDVETYRAILPSLATTGGMLVGISTPYRKLGLLHQKHREYFGQDSADVLVVQGPTTAFNPLLSEAIIAAQRAADPAAALSEWDAEFRTDVSALFDDEQLEAAIDHDRPLEIPPDSTQHYQAFVDANGGGPDAYTVAIAHRHGDTGLFVVDAVRGIVRGDPYETTRDFAELVRQYNIGRVDGDAYAAEWVTAAWQDHNISYQKSDLPRSQIYLEVLPLFNRGLVRLPNHPKLIRELRQLERYTHKSV
jgi:hypothetical protein